MPRGAVNALWSMRNLFKGQAEIHAAYQKRYKARNIKSEPPAITMIGRIEALKLFGASWENLEPVRLHVYAQRTTHNNPEHGDLLRHVGIAYSIRVVGCCADDFRAARIKSLAETLRSLY